MQLWFVKCCFQTANATLWTLYLLARNPKIQRALADDINRVLPNKGDVTVKNIQDLHFVKACLKETFR